jgi:hypothetical protein
VRSSDFINILANNSPPRILPEIVILILSGFEGILLHRRRRRLFWIIFYLNNSWPLAFGENIL